MIVEYSYLKMNGEEFGFYQCDMEDFKKFFWSRSNEDIRCIVLKKGKIKYIWDKGNVGLKGRVRGKNGWMYVGNVGV